MTNDKVDFHGFEVPDQNWFRLPNSWTDLTRDITSLAELKVVEYVLRHTWGHREYAIAKQISINEFMNGRRRKDGSRIDRGTGLSNRSVIDGLKKAVHDGYLIERRDDADKARIKKYYLLRMKGSGAPGLGDLRATQTPPGERPDDATNPGTSTGRKILQPGVKNLHRGVKNLHSGGEESSHRSEKDTVDRHFAVTGRGNRKSCLYELPDLQLPRDHLDLIQADIVDHFGDAKSKPLYALIASKIPETVIRRHVSEIKHTPGVVNPAALFTHRIHRWAQSQLDAQRRKKLDEMKSNLRAATTV